MARQGRARALTLATCFARSSCCFSCRSTVIPPPHCLPHGWGTLVCEAQFGPAASAADRIPPLVRRHSKYRDDRNPAAVRVGAGHHPLRPVTSISRIAASRTRPWWWPSVWRLASPAVGVDADGIIGASNASWMESQDNDRVDRGTGAGGQVQRRDDAQERPPPCGRARPGEFSDVQPVHQVQAEGLDGEHVHREINARGGAGGGVIVAVAAQGADAPFGEEWDDGRVQSGPCPGGIPRSPLGPALPVADADEGDIALPHPDLLVLLRGE